MKSKTVVVTQNEDDVACSGALRCQREQHKERDDTGLEVIRVRHGRYHGMSTILPESPPDFSKVFSS